MLLDEFKNLKKGDILEECEYGECIESEIITDPIFDGDTISWKSQDLNSDRIIDYFVNTKYLHYAPKVNKVY